LQISCNKRKLTVEHDGRALGRLADISRLLPQLAHGALLRRLALVDQPGGDLDRDGVDRRAELLLEDDLRACLGELVKEKLSF
jgi:hypothetical protein